ncbi:MAG TPA: type II toxin-antitoxin system VapC family toxin [Chloroflexota bacterium]|nr:type II toxin-antitoxin system VapC family toxin [Chloroflexota bacterium]
MTKIVLDASALLALLAAEPGAEMVADTIPGANIGAVNLEEVVGKLALRGMPEAEIRNAVSALGLSVHPFTEQLAVESGLLRPTTDHYGLSLGDRAALALARHLGLPTYTSDSAWQDVGPAIDVTVRLIR